MKHKADIVIDADRATVWQLFDDPDNLKKWQPTLKSFTHRSGVQGHPDAVSELVFDERGRDVPMTLTITARREQAFLGGTYESAWGTVVVFNLFEDFGHEKTRWVVNSNYRFRGLMKIMALFTRAAILRRVDDDLHRFKLLVESATARELS
ncbi:MAG: SRPBCC family protein [Woeseiaceae bacterium]|nr:SRPBCC family protein [Woeseiaceae bacterium]